MHTSDSSDELCTRIRLGNDESVELRVSGGMLFLSRVRRRWFRRRAADPFYMAPVDDVDLVLERLGRPLGEDQRWFFQLVDALGRFPSFEMLNEAFKQETGLERANTIVTVVSNRMRELESKRFLTPEDLGFDKGLAEQALSYMISYWRRRPSREAHANRAERLLTILREVADVPDEFRPLLDEANEIMQAHPTPDSITADENMIITAARGLTASEKPDERRLKEILILARTRKNDGSVRQNRDKQ